MKIVRVLPALLVCVLVLPSAHAQDKQDSGKKAEAHPTASRLSFLPSATGPMLHVQIVLEEFDGSKKISSLPYTVHLMAGRGTFEDPGSASLRLNERVPYATGGFLGGAGVNTQYSYQNVGTNIDCAASDATNSKYQVKFKIERSSASMPDSAGVDTSSKSDQPRVGSQPLFRSFTNSFSLIMRDGQTMEGTSAVDPTTGHVIKVEVTLTVVK